MGPQIPRPDPRRHEGPEVRAGMDAGIGQKILPRHADVADRPDPAPGRGDAPDPLILGLDVLSLALDPVVVQIEDEGHFLVIVDLGCKYKRPAYYDDLLTLRTTVTRVTLVKIVHAFEVSRDGLLLAEGHSTLACVDREGRPQALPAVLRPEG